MSERAAGFLHLFMKGKKQPHVHKGKMHPLVHEGIKSLCKWLQIEVIV
jgi:hypothetical protein